MLVGSLATLIDDTRMNTSPEHPLATPTASTVEGGSVAANAGLEPTARIENEMRSNDPSFPTLPEISISPVSSSMRKAQVRAALFQKKVAVKIGRFTLLERLGAGAMGEIYAAYDDRLDRAVALKLVRHGSDHTVKADELLLREAQALAQVSHPNVVQIYEAGTHGGRLFIAMELIRGGTLTSWLEDHARLPRPHRQREILRLFIAAGRGLEAAHSAGVAHRDFKPDNVLVGKDGRVCVVDFGLARVLVDDPTLRLSPPAPGDDDATVTDDFSQGETLPIEPGEPGAAPSDGSRLGRLGEREASSAGDAPKRTAATRLTRTGTVMGTPRFMAPEQIRGGVPDHRSDQFSFCVALYHALYGAFPFDGEHPQELPDSIRTGVTGLEHSVGFGARLRKALCRGLSVDPSQRFPNMGELLAALEPGLRRRRGWIAGAVLLFSIIGGIAYLWSQPPADPCNTAGAGIAAAWSLDRQADVQAAFARSDLPYADTGWRSTKQRIDGYATRWRDDAVAACRATYVDRAQSEQQYDRRRLCLERGSRQLDALVSELKGGASDAIQHAVEATEQLPDLAVCSRTENAMFGLEPPPPAVASEVSAVREKLARALTLEQLGLTEESLAIAREVRTITERLKYRPAHAEALVQIARSLDRRETAEARREAETLYFDALDIAEAERHDQLAAMIWNRLVALTVQMDASMQKAHERWRRNAAAVKRIGDSSSERAMLHHLFGEIYYKESKYGDAADEQSLAIAAASSDGGQSIELSRYYAALAKSLEPQGRVDEAISLYERAEKIATEALGPTHPEVIKRKMNYGHALRKQGKLERARTVLEAALASMPAKYRESSLDAGIVHTFLADLAYTEWKLDDAVTHGRAALDIYQRVGAPATRSAEAYVTIANAEIRRKNFAEALAMYNEALTMRRSLGPDHYQVGVNHGSIAEVLVGLGRHEEAIPHVIEAERIFAVGSARHRGLEEWLLTVHGRALVGQHQPDAAVQLLERALPLYEGGADPGGQAHAMFALARALHDLGRDPRRVRDLAEKSRSLFATLSHETSNRDAVTQFIEQLSYPPASSIPVPGRRLSR